MIGQRFGKWVVIKHNIAVNGTKNYLCRCDCGEESVVWRSGLTTGKSLQCKKCSIISRSKNNQKSENQYTAEEMVGKEFHSWNVLELLLKRSSNGGYLFLCQCVCGIKKKIQGVLLRRGTSKRCIKCSNKNNMPPCRYCKCKNHKNIDLETSECDHVGVCPVCDKFNFKNYIAALDSN